jgi:hypothetical protein
MKVAELCRYENLIMLPSALTPFTDQLFVVVVVVSSVPESTPVCESGIQNL